MPNEHDAGPIDATRRYRFVELYYHRRETGRVQTVVVFLPDVRSCVPTADEWQAQRQQYKMALQRAIDRNDNSPPSPSKASNSSSTTGGADKEARTEERSSEAPKTDAESSQKEKEVATEVEMKDQDTGLESSGVAETKDTAMEVEQEQDEEKLAEPAEQMDQDEKQPEEAESETAVDDKAVRLITLNLFSFCASSLPSRVEDACAWLRCDWVDVVEE